MPHRAFPLHCQSNRVSLDGMSRYVPLNAQEVHDDRPVRFTIYGWSHFHKDLSPFRTLEEHEHPFDSSQLERDA
jgi:hypothetical protein